MTGWRLRELWGEQLMETYESIRTRYLAITKVWQPNRTSMPIFKRRRDDESCHLEITDNGTYAIVGTERGMETDRKETRSLDELMYWIASGEASARGLEYEFDHRKSIDDFRRVYFSKAVEELAQISAEWADRLRCEHADILKAHPFFDDPFNELATAQS
jgi:Immunity protein 63